MTHANPVQLAELLRASAAGSTTPPRPPPSCSAGTAACSPASTSSPPASTTTTTAPRPSPGSCGKPSPTTSTGRRCRRARPASCAWSPSWAASTPASRSPTCSPGLDDNNARLVLDAIAHALHPRGPAMNAPTPRRPGVVARWTTRRRPAAGTRCDECGEVLVDIACDGCGQLAGEIVGMLATVVDTPAGARLVIAEHTPEGWTPVRSRPGHPRQRRRPVPARRHRPRPGRLDARGAVVTATDTARRRHRRRARGAGWPLQPLLDACGLTPSRLAAELGLSGTTVRTAARAGPDRPSGRRVGHPAGPAPAPGVGLGLDRPGRRAPRRPAHVPASPTRSGTGSPAASCAPVTGCPASTRWPNSSGVGSKTVVRALDELRAEGLVVGGIGRGRPATVASTVPRPGPRAAWPVGGRSRRGRSTTRIGRTARWPPTAGATATRPRTPSAAQAVPGGGS